MFGSSSGSGLSSEAERAALGPDPERGRWRRAGGGKRFPLPRLQPPRGYPRGHWERGATTLLFLIWGKFSAGRSYPALAVSASPASRRRRRCEVHDCPPGRFFPPSWLFGGDPELRSAAGSSTEANRVAAFSPRPAGPPLFFFPPSLLVHVTRGLASPGCLQSSVVAGRAQPGETG